MTDGEGKSGRTLGQAIDAIVDALRDLDGATRTSAIRAACDHLSIAAPQGVARQEHSDGGVAGREGTVRPPSAGDIRSLKEAKQPKSVNEMAALVAYYLQEVAGADDRKTEVDVADMETYFKQGGFRLPRATRQILLNAKKSGYFDSAGSGKFRLNPVGYNLVVHNLPKGSSQGAQQRRPKKKPAKKKTTGRRAR